MTICAKKAAAECVSEEALSHLRTYKYSSVDNSYISRNIMNPYWTACVELVPLWVAPNMVTLIGFFFILSNIALLLCYIPDLVGPAPGWVYISFGIGIFMYQTMDNIDGKQARRTGTSSGLGELFDHGIDSLNCTLASLLEVAAFAYGSTSIGAFVAISPTLAMFFSTWETFHTHTLYLGAVNGPTEGILLLTAALVATGFFGPGIWTATLADTFGLFSNESLIGATTLRDTWVFLMTAGLLFMHIPSCVMNVIRDRRKNNLPVVDIVYEWTTIIVFSLGITCWLGSPFSTLLSNNHLVLFCVTLAFVFGRMTTKMILAHLTRQPFPFWTHMLTPLIGGATLANLPFFGFPPVSPQIELLYLWAYLIFAAVIYFRWAFLVVGSICDYLGINALTIPMEKQLENAWKREAAVTAAASPPVALESIAAPSTAAASGPSSSSSTAVGSPQSGYKKSS